MRFKITLHSLDRNAVLPLSYQYEMSSWIYRILAAGEPVLAKFLHEKGYCNGQRRFKLFNFSNLNVPQYKTGGDRLFVLSPSVSFQIAFLEHKAATALIGGLLQNSAPFALGDKKSKSRFSLQGVEEIQSSLPKHNTLHFHTTSPMFVTRPKIKPNGRLGKDFLSPTDPDFGQKLTENLWSKYHAARQEGLVEEVPAESRMYFKMHSKEPKKKGVRIKAFTTEETHNIGYLFDFELTAPKELLRLGLLGGFGEGNAIGFGATDILSSNFKNQQI